MRAAMSETLPYVEKALMIETTHMNMVEGFGQVLGGRRAPAAVAADHNPPLLVHASSALVTPDKRQETLSTMLTHMIHGQAIGLVCACAPRRCHGEIILEKLKKMYCEIAK